MALLSKKKKSPKKSVDLDEDIDSVDVDASSEAVSPSKKKTSSGEGVLNVGSKNYAVGLLWNTVSDIANGAKEAKEAAKRPNINADYYCVRGSTTPQYGLGYSSSGHKSGMPSLAAHMAASEEGNWIGIFRHGEYFYLIAVRDDAILADCDRVFRSEDQAREEFSDLYYTSNWAKAYAPKEWGIEGSEVRVLDDVLVGNPPVKLADTNTVKVLIKYGGLLLVAGVVLIGGMQAYNYFTTEETFEQVEAVYNDVQTKVIEQVAPQQEVEVPPPVPWANQPIGISMLASCVSDIKDMPLQVAGWEPEQMLCSGETVSMLLRKNGGSINWIGHSLNDAKPVKPNIIPIDVNNVEIAYPLSGISVYPENIETLPLAQVRRYLLSHFDENFMTVQISESSTFYQDDRELSDKTSRYYQKINFQFSSEYNPLDFVSILSRIPVMTINEVRYDLKGDRWTVSGNIFEKRKEPIPKPTP